jgi:hypothetical protein
MLPAQKKALAVAGALRVALIAGGGGLCWYRLRLLVPAWLFWGACSFYIAGGLAWVVWINRDIRRMNRERLELSRLNAEALHAMQPYVDELLAGMFEVQARRAELWRSVMGPHVPMPHEREKPN